MRVLVAQARARASGGAEAYAAAVVAHLTAQGHHVGTLDIDGHTPPEGNRQRLPWVRPGRILWNWAQVCRALPAVSLQYDRVILAFGEGPHLPVPSLTIRHAPALFSTHPKLLSFLGAKPTTLRRAYVALCRGWARIPAEPVSTLTIANTQWTATQARLLNAATVSDVLYPPLDLPETIPARRRPFRLLALGRIALNKRLEEAIEVLDRLRAEGLPAELDICGHASGSYARRFAARYANHPHVRLILNANAETKARVLSEATLGLHMFRGEHFGIAIAEMIHAGIVPLVYDDGGVCELVTTPDLRFTSANGATRIAARLLTRPDLIHDSRHELQKGTALARARQFPAELDRVLDGFLCNEGTRHVA